MLFRMLFRLLFRMHFRDESVERAGVSLLKRVSSHAEEQVGEHVDHRKLHFLVTLVSSKLAYDFNTRERDERR